MGNETLVALNLLSRVKPNVFHNIHNFETTPLLQAKCKIFGKWQPTFREKARLVERSAVMVDILKLAETHTNAAILQTLKVSYGADNTSEAFETFEALEKEGLLFNSGESLEKTSRHKVSGGSSC